MIPTHRFDIVRRYGRTLGVLILGFLPAAANAGTSLGLQRTASKAGLSSGGDPVTFVGNILGAVLGFTGVIFLVLMIYGGFMWMTAGGNENRITAAKKTIVAAVVGIVIVFASFYIVEFIINAGIAGLRASPTPSSPAPTE